MNDLNIAEKAKINVVYPNLRLEVLRKSPAVEKQPKSFRANITQIKDIQIFLKENFSYKGGITGKLNRETRNSLKKFQKSESLKVTGTINQETFDKMLNFSRKKIQPSLFENVENVIETITIKTERDNLPEEEIVAAPHFVSGNYRFAVAKQNPAALFLDGKSDYLAIAALFLLFSIALIAAFIFN